MKAIPLFEGAASTQQGCLHESLTQICLPQLIGFTLHLNKLTTDQVSETSIRKDLLTYIGDATSNADNFLYCIHGTYKKTSNNNPPKMQGQMIQTHLSQTNGKDRTQVQ